MGIKSGAVNGLSRAGLASAFLGTPTTLQPRGGGSATPNARTVWSRTRYPVAEQPYQLFLRGEQGAWYDPSDLSTLFQDTAGQVPVTAVEQPVGRMLDKSGNGNHVTASADTRRPIFRALYNQAQRTEEFNDAYWTKTDVTVTQDQIAAPDGTVTADRINVSATNASHFVTVLLPNAVVGKNYTKRLYVQKGTHDFIQLLLGGNAFGVNAWANFNVNTGVVGTVGTAATASIEDVGNGWYLCTVSANATSAVAAAYTFSVVPSATATRNQSWLATGNETLFVWGADYRFTADGVGLPVYQRVVTSTIYDVADFSPYLAFDGVDDCLFTATAINMTATDQVTVCLGARKLSDVAFNAICEFSVNPETELGSFNATASLQRGGSRATWSAIINGNSLLAGGALTYTAPDTRVSVALLNIAETTASAECVLRLNGLQQTLDFAVFTSAGTGNLGNHQLFLGARNNASVRFNGRLYGLIVRGRLTPSPTLEQTEAWMNGKTRAF
jgi:hypothetical protein